MKFNEIKTSEEVFKKDQNIKEHVTQDDIIDSMFRYGSVGVYIMKNGKKGLFREIASYINDGEKPTSWALKIFNTGGWYIQFGVNPNVDTSTNDIYLSDIFSVFEQKFPNIKISGNKKVVLISEISNRHEVEQISHYIINMFKEIQLDFVDKTLNEKFTLKETTKNIEINGFYSENKIDEDSHRKFSDIIEKFSSISMSNKDTSVFKKIKSKLDNNEILNENDKQLLNDLMKDYFSTHERVSIAMKYLKKD